MVNVTGSEIALICYAFCQSSLPNACPIKLSLTWQFAVVLLFKVLTTPKIWWEEEGNSHHALPQFPTIALRGNSVHSLYHSIFPPYFYTSLYQPLNAVMTVIFQEPYYFSHWISKKSKYLLFYIVRFISTIFATYSWRRSYCRRLQFSHKLFWKYSLQHWISMIYQPITFQRVRLPFFSPEQFYQYSFAISIWEKLLIFPPSWIPSDMCAPSQTIGMQVRPLQVKRKINLVRRKTSTAILHTLLKERKWTEICCGVIRRARKYLSVLW